ncbi:MAG: hypothetical protein FJ242_06105 [Nitrospira sp.]|nr:hypothetical protein [Nitrospira sp.]
MSPRLIAIHIKEDDRSSILYYYVEAREDALPAEEKRELNLYLKSVANYILIHKAFSAQSKLALILLLYS